MSDKFDLNFKMVKLDHLVQYFIICRLLGLRGNSGGTADCSGDFVVSIYNLIIFY